MSSHRHQAPRRRARFAAGAALLLVAEAALIAGASMPTSAAPAPEPGAAKVVQPSKADILTSDIAWAAEHAKGSKAWAITEAEKTGKKVVVTDETTPTTYTVANPDGTLTTELTAGPERVRKNGAWRKADATLTEAADGSVVAKAHPNGLRLGGKGGTQPKSLRAAQDDTARDLVTLGTGDSEVTLRWKGGLPRPELDGTTATYKNAVPGADVVVEATRTGFEQFVEIGERSTGAYTYTLPVRAKGLKSKANKDGSVTFKRLHRPVDRGAGCLPGTAHPRPRRHRLVVGHVKGSADGSAAQPGQTATAPPWTALLANSCAPPICAPFAMRRRNCARAAGHGCLRSSPAIRR